MHVLFVHYVTIFCYFGRFLPPLSFSQRFLATFFSYFDYSQVAHPLTYEFPNKKKNIKNFFFFFFFFLGNS